MDDNQSNSLASAVRDLSRSIALVGFLLLLGLSGVQCQMMALGDKLDSVHVRMSGDITTHEGASRPFTR